MRGSDARSHTVTKSSPSTFTVNQKIGISHTFTKPLLERKPSDGPDGPPRNSVAAIADIVMTFMNSARKKIANRMPVYSVLNPPTSSCSASTRSKGGWFVSAVAAIRKITNGTSARSQNQSRANESGPIHACCVTIACVESVPRLDQHAEHGEAERGFVREQLRGRAHRAEQRVLRARRPTREHHAVHADARHREDEQRAHREVGDLQVRAVPEDRDRAADRHDAEQQERGQDRQVRREPEHGAVGRRGDRLLLEEELDAVGQGLQHAVGTGAVRADAVLHVGDDLAHAPDVEHHRHEQEHEREHDLDQHDREHRPRHVTGEERVDRDQARRSSQRLHAQVGDRGVGVDQLGRAGAVGGELELRDARRARRASISTVSSRDARPEVTRTSAPDSTPRAAASCGLIRSGKGRRTRSSAAASLTMRPLS